MAKMGRFVVETHGHITSLYDSVGDNPSPEGWKGLPIAPGSGEVEFVDNSGLTIYDMECYGVDMVMLYPSVTGTTNESQLKLVEKYPDKFRAFCADQTTRLRCQREGVEWRLGDSLEEIEKAAVTGKFIGIGEFSPRCWDKTKFYGAEERYNELCALFDIAQKYKLPTAFHEVMWQDYEWDPWKLLMRLAGRYPDVKIIVNHGGHSIGSYIFNDMNIRKSLQAAGRYTGNGGEPNIFLEVGTWNAEQIRMAVEDPNVGPTQLLWGSDYGHVPQYLTTNPARAGMMPESFSTSMKRWMPVPAYQCDWWGWEVTQIERLKQCVGQDEINLILGGNAAKLFKLPVPYERMFMCGRPDVFGIHWKESIPYIPLEQIQNPDDKRANRKLLGDEFFDK